VILRPRQRGLGGRSGGRERARGAQRRQRRRCGPGRRIGPGAGGRRFSIWYRGASCILQIPRCRRGWRRPPGHL